MLEISGLICLYILVVLVSLPLIGRWILRSMNPANRVVHAPRRFFLSDFIWLLILLQASFAAVALIPTEQTAVFTTILVFLLCSVLAMWAAATSVLSRAGVYQALRRGVFVLLVLPGVLFVLGGAAMWGLILLAGIEAVRKEEMSVWLAIVSSGVVGVPLLAWLLRLATNWIVAGAEFVEPTANDAERQDAAN